jgi:hypothetical protein
MSVVLICPSCAEPYTLHRTPVPELCDRCHAAFPDSVRRVADRTLRADATPRPLLLTLGLGFITLWLGVGVLILVIALVGNGPYTVNGQPATKSEFFGDPFVLSLAPIIIMTAWVAWVLWRERPWARPLMLGFWFVVYAPAIFVPNADWASRLAGILSLAVSITIASWYLYGKANVVAYFQRLGERNVSRTDG